MVGGNSGCFATAAAARRVSLDSQIWRVFGSDIELILLYDMRKLHRLSKVSSSLQTMQNQLLVILDCALQTLKREGFVI